MADTYPTVTFPCSVNSVPFYPAVSMRQPSDAMVNWGQDAYINSLLPWQSVIPYENKRLFSDTITLQFKTQANSAYAVLNPAEFSYTNLAKLYICSSVPGASGPVPGTIISGFTNRLNPVGNGPVYNNINGGSSASVSFWGIQTPTYDIYTDPVTGAQTPLVSYMWQFTFGDILNSATDSGVYFIRFDNIDVDGAIITSYSEPIFLLGTDALVTFPNTLYFKASNSINKNDIIIDGWFNYPNAYPVFYTRVEADILEYEQKGIYLGFLQQAWLAKNTYTKSWKVWSLNIGSVTLGIPATLFEIITKFMEMDIIVINNQYYTYDIQSGGSQSASAAWKIEKARWKGLFTGTLPVRYVYDNQFFVGDTIIKPRIFSNEFSDEFD